MVLDTDKKHKVIKEDCFYDIIGDIHGCANELEELLERLGYVKTSEVWRNTQRKAVFVGDFIDRGPDSRRVMQIIRGMMECDNAYAILGNHELNAILYLTKENGKPIRKPTESSRRLIEKVRKEFIDEPKLLKDYIKWLRTLPLHLDFGAFRVVHAYWNDELINLIEEYRPHGKFKKSALKLMANINHPLCNAINRVTKGIEFRLPDDLIIKDSTNIRRNNFRIKWWESPKGKTFHELSYGNKFKLPDYTVPEQILFPFHIYEADEPMVFFGHYCMGKELLNPKSNICCVDACIANGGALAAYRWRGESEVNLDNIVYVQASYSVVK